MSSSVFGNLREWGQVPDKLASLVESNTLQQHEDEIIRVLRYPDNWRLRELVLLTLKDHGSPSAGILTAVSDILADNDVYYEARVLAAETLTRLVQQWPPGTTRNRAKELASLFERLTALTASSHEPVLDAGILACLETVKEARRPLQTRGVVTAHTAPA